MVPAHWCGHCGARLAAALGRERVFSKQLPPCAVVCCGAPRGVLLPLLCRCSSNGRGAAVRGVCVQHCHGPLGCRCAGFSKHRPLQADEGVVGRWRAVLVQQGTCTRDGTPTAITRPTPTLDTPTTRHLSQHFLQSVTSVKPWPERQGCPGCVLSGHFGMLLVCLVRVDPAHATPPCIRHPSCAYKDGASATRKHLQSVRLSVACLQRPSRQLRRPNTPGSGCSVWRRCAAARDTCQQRRGARRSKPARAFDTPVAGRARSGRLAGGVA
jgi:hypothetical protein